MSYLEHEERRREALVHPWLARGPRPDRRALFARFLYADVGRSVEVYEVESERAIAP